MCRLKAEFERKRPHLNRLEMSKRLEVVKESAPSTRRYCHTCERLLIGADLEEHRGHDVKEGLFVNELNHPTSFLTPMDNKKSQAVSQNWREGGGGRGIRSPGSFVLKGDMVEKGRDVTG